jgi:hypothetical protein
VGWGMIVPRLGIAYRVTERTVIRAGGGMTVDPDNFRTMRDTYGAVTALNPSGLNAFTNGNCLQAAGAELNPGMPGRRYRSNCGAELCYRISDLTYDCYDEYPAQALSSRLY